MFLPIGWWVCVSLLVPADRPAPPAASAEPPTATHEKEARPPTADAAHLAAKLDRYFAGAAGLLDPRPRETLRRIPDRERRLLAVAHYLRRRHQVDTLWTWRAEEARAHQGTAEYRRAMEHLRRVRRAFAERNPGYALVTDTNARPLGAQLRYWNREASVRLAARELRDSAATWLAGETYPALPDSSALARFVGRLQAYSPTLLPTVAVPGLSLHGQLRAYDFAILRRGRVIAGTQSATMDSVWERGGWTERLRSAVARAGADLVGPLELPREPWHYEHNVETP